MKIFKKVIIGVLILGGLVTIVGFIMNGFNFKNIFNFNDNRSIQTINEDGDINELVINANIDDVEFKISNTGKLIIEYYDEVEDPFYQYTYSEKTATLEWIKTVQFVGLIRRNRKIIVYLPSNTLNILNCTITTGEVKVEDISLNINELNVTTTTGDIELDNITTNNAVLKTTTGDVELKNIKAEKMTTKVTTGQIDVEQCNINDASIASTTGKIEVTSSTLQKVKISATTARVYTQNLITEDIDVKTTTGAVSVNLTGKISDYSVSADALTGSIRLIGTNLDIKNSDNIIWGNGAKSITVNTTTGSILIRLS